MISRALARLAVIGVAALTAMTSGLVATPAAASAAPAKPDSGKPASSKPEQGKKPDAGKPASDKPGKEKKPDPGKPASGKPGKEKKPDLVKAHVNVPDYTGVCPPAKGITAKGVIKADHTITVKYRWLHNGKVVGQGQVKVVRDKKVFYTFKPDKSHTGWVALEIVTPPHGVLDRDNYTVKCKKEEEPPRRRSR